MTCPHLVDSGVYVLGALSPAQRLAFEQHMGTCAECQAEVGDLAVLPGLLGRLDEPAVLATAEPMPPTILPGVLATVHKKRRRRRAFVAAVGAAVACLALFVGIVLPSHSGGPAQAPIAWKPMNLVAASEPLTAQIGFTSVDGGTQIHIKCHYPKSTAPAYGGREWFALYVYPRSGAPAQQVGTWSAKPGQDMTVPAITSWPLTRMERVELRSDEGVALLVYTL